MSTEAERRPKVRGRPAAPAGPGRGGGGGGRSLRGGRGVRPTGPCSRSSRARSPAIGVGRRRGAAKVTKALLLAFGALGGGWHHYRWSDLAADDLARGVDETPRPAWVRGVLGEVLGFRPGEFPGDRGSTRAVLDLTGVNDGRRWHRASGRVEPAGRGGPDRPGGGPRGRGRRIAGEDRRAAEPGRVRRPQRLPARGIRLRMTVDDPRGVWEDPGSPGRLLSRWLGAARAWSYSRLVAGLDPRAAPLAAALLLGRREGVDPDVNDAFARTGTTHLLAISGLHLQALAVALWLVFRVLGLPRRGAFALVALATIAYALLVGLMPSVVRSAAMTVTVCLAGMLDRSTRPANLLALAALVTLLVNPAHLFDTGCQLSFLAVAAVFWGIPLLSHVFEFSRFHLLDRYRPLDPLDALERRHEPWWRSSARKGREVILEGLMLSVAVWLVTAPLVSLRFHLVSPIGILLNVPLIPLTSLALLASGLTLVLSAIWAPLGMPSAWICGGLLDLTERVTRWGAARPWGHRFVAGPSWSWVLVLYALMTLVAAAGIGRWPARRWARVALAGWLVLGLVWTWSPRRPEALEADVLAVGHGLAVVIQSADGRTFLYDCGRMRDPGVGRRIVAPALWERGVTHLDAVILSHADADHYNGLPDLLDRFSIGVVRVPPGFAGPANPGAVRLLEDVRARGVPVRPIVAGDRWEAAGARFSALSPPATGRPSSTDNARSVVLDVESGGRHALLTGDLEGDGLADLVERPGRAVRRGPRPAPRRPVGEPALVLPMGPARAGRRQPAPAHARGERPPRPARRPEDPRAAHLGARGDPPALVRPRHFGTRFSGRVQPAGRWSMSGRRVHVRPRAKPANRGMTGRTRSHRCHPPCLFMPWHATGRARPSP